MCRHLQKQILCVHEQDHIAACMCADAANVVQSLVAVPGLQGCTALQLEPQCHIASIWSPGEVSVNMSDYCSSKASICGWACSIFPAICHGCVSAQPLTRA